MGRKRGSGKVHGIVLVDKPSGPTSSATMRTVQRSLGAAKAGHAGTLDPLATGLLIVMLGEATKLSPWLMGREKSYIAEVEFGWATDTLDSQGTVLRKEAVPPDRVSPEAVERCLRELQAQTEQVPPVYSALKRQGKRLMELARQGHQVEVEAREAKCHKLELLQLSHSSLRLAADVGSGYYIRSLARDIGEWLGVPTVLTSLRRTSVGGLSVDEACCPERVSPESVIPIARVLDDVPTVTLAQEQARAVMHGKETSLDVPTGAHRAIACTLTGSPVAMMTPSTKSTGLWRVLRGFQVPELINASSDDTVIDNGRDGE